MRRMLLLATLTLALPVSGAPLCRDAKGRPTHCLTKRAGGPSAQRGARPGPKPASGAAKRTGPADASAPAPRIATKDA